jgi:hypothetical protein
MIKSNRYRAWYDENKYVREYKNIREEHKTKKAELSRHA